MKLLRSLTIASAVGLALAASAATAQANPGAGCSGPGCAGGGFGAGGPATLAGALFGNRGGGGGFGLSLHRPKLPVFQAAPWYQYWPYDGHFLTPAPVNGAFYGPPLTGNFPVNPYFPGGYGAAGFGYGGIPGGPPTGYPSMPTPYPPGR